jgi:hypothetical protein
MWSWILSWFVWGLIFFWEIDQYRSEIVLWSSLKSSSERWIGKLLVSLSQNCHKDFLCTFESLLTTSSQVRQSDRIFGQRLLFFLCSMTSDDLFQAETTVKTTILVVYTRENYVIKRYDNFSTLLNSKLIHQTDEIAATCGGIF